jgi:hypothetical protein
MKYGRNREGLVFYVGNIIEAYVQEIIKEMDEIIWIGMKDCLDKILRYVWIFLYCPPINSKWFNANFLRDLQEDINMLTDRYVNT